MVKTRMKNVIKDVRGADAQNSEETYKILNEAKSIIAKAAKKGVIHKKTASRKISRLSKFVNSLSV
jgi:small subunit ribosomal protein S20